MEWWVCYLSRHLDHHHIRRYECEISGRTPRESPQPSHSRWWTDTQWVYGTYPSRGTRRWHYLIPHCGHISWSLNKVMNSLVIKSCKHQNNSITFIREADSIYVEWAGKDSWTQTDAIIPKNLLNVKDIKILRWRWDNDITVTIEAAKNTISAVIGSPWQAWDIFNSKDTYKSFNSILEWTSTIHELLLKILD